MFDRVLNMSLHVGHLQENVCKVYVYLKLFIHYLKYIIEIILKNNKLPFLLPLMIQTSQ